MREVVCRVLREAGYEVIEAANGRQAVDLFVEQASEIDLVLLDVVMPILNGKDAYEEIARLRPEVKVLFSSGYTTDALPAGFLESRGISMVSKPYHPSVLLKAVHTAIAL